MRRKGHFMISSTTKFWFLKNDQQLASERCKHQHNILYTTQHTQKNLATKQCNFQHFLLHLEVAQFHFSMEIHSRDCSLLKRGSKVLKIIIPEKFLPHQHHRRSQVYLVKSFLNLLIINISLKTFFCIYLCTLPTVLPRAPN